MGKHALSLLVLDAQIFLLRGPPVGWLGGGVSAAAAEAPG